MRYFTPFARFRDRFLAVAVGLMGAGGEKPRQTQMRYLSLREAFHRPFQILERARVLAPVTVIIRAKDYRPDGARLEPERPVKFGDGVIEFDAGG